MRTLIIIAVITWAVALMGCSHVSINVKKGTVDRRSFLQDIAVQSIDYDPDTGHLRVEGVDSDARFEAVAAAVEALR